MANIIAEVAGVQSKPIKISRPKWEDMLRNYPNTSVKTKNLYDEIGGGLPEYLKASPTDWENSCCIRMSKALNYSGIKLPSASSQGGTIIGKDKNKYWIRVRDLKQYMENRFNLPDIEVPPSDVAVDSFKGKKGIIVFEVSGWGNAAGHFTLWDGQNLIYPGNPLYDDPTSRYYYFNMKYQVDMGNGKAKEIKTTKIYLWELK